MLQYTSWCLGRNSIILCSREQGAILKKILALFWLGTFWQCLESSRLPFCMSTLCITWGNTSSLPNSETDNICFTHSMNRNPLEHTAFLLMVGYGCWSQDLLLLPCTKWAWTPDDERKLPSLRNRMFNTNLSLFIYLIIFISRTAWLYQQTFPANKAKYHLHTSVSLREPAL